MLKFCYKLEKKGAQMVYYGLYFLFAVSNKYAQIKFGRAVKNIFDLLIFSLITGTIASVFFFLMSGFKININLPTLIYSLIFAAVVIVVHFSNLLLYRATDVSSATVLTSAMNLVFTFIVGILFLSEDVGIFDLSRCAIMIAASVLLHFPAGKHKTAKARFNFKGIFLALVTAAVGVIAAVISNLFAKDSRVTDSNSFFFLTNVLVIIFTASAIAVIKKGRLSLVVHDLRSFSARGYALVAISTVSSNMGSLLQILIFESGDGITLYTPISGALGLIAAGIVAILEKERPKILPLLLACASLFVGLL